MDGWMDFEDGEDGGGRRERVKARLNDAYRLFAPRFQIRQISKSDRGRVINLQSPNHWKILYILRNTKGAPKGNVLLYELRATSLIIL